MNMFSNEYLSINNCIYIFFAVIFIIYNGRYLYYHLDEFNKILDIYLQHRLY